MTRLCEGRVAIVTGAGRGIGREHALSLAPGLVEVYFQEIRPPQALRAAWASQRQDGVEWQERYRKVAKEENLKFE